MIQLSISDFTCTPNNIPPSGEDVSLLFKAVSGGNPDRLRVTYSIKEAPFIFKTPQGETKEIFLPSRDKTIAAPTRRSNVGPKRTKIVPVGSTQAHTAPLSIHLKVDGFFQGQRVVTQKDACLVTINMLHQQAAAGELVADGALAMALRLVNKDVGVSQRRLAEILSSGVGKGINVSEFMVSKVIQGGSSADLLKTLRGK